MGQFQKSAKIDVETRGLNGSMDGIRARKSTVEM